MQKFFLGLLTTLVLVIGFVSCSSDDSSVDGNDSSFSGKWYLKDYSNYSSIIDNPDLSKCTWGEYIEFSGSKMHWNSQYRGDNVTYDYTVLNGTEIYLTNSRGDVQLFSVKKHTKNVLVVYCADDTYRYFTR